MSNDEKKSDEVIDAVFDERPAQTPAEQRAEATRSVMTGRVLGHFLADLIASGNRALLGVVPAPGYPGVNVEIHYPTRRLIVRPTMVPMLQTGKRLVKLPAEWTVWGAQPGSDEPRDLELFRKQAWWVTADTVDPMHSLTDWNPGKMLASSVSIATPADVRRFGKVRPS